MIDLLLPDMDNLINTLHRATIASAELDRSLQRFADAFWGAHKRSHLKRRKRSERRSVTKR